jgi:hypothetical protein
MSKRGSLVPRSGKEAGYQRELMLGQRDGWVVGIMGRESIRNHFIYVNTTFVQIATWHTLTFVMPVIFNSQAHDVC